MTAFVATVLVTTIAIVVVASALLAPLFTIVVFVVAALLAPAIITVAAVTAITTVTALAVAVVTTTRRAAASAALFVIILLLIVVSPATLLHAVAAVLSTAHELVTRAWIDHAVRVVRLGGRVAHALGILIVARLEAYLAGRVVLLVESDDLPDVPIDHLVLFVHDLAQSGALALSLDQRSDVQLLCSHAARLHEDFLDAAARSAAAL